MRVVAENSDADLARQHATVEVKRALREMTANLLRVIRSAEEAARDRPAGARAP